MMRTAALTLVLLIGATWTGAALVSAANRTDPGLGFEVGEEETLGPLPTASPSETAPVHPSLSRGATVSFFGDSQALTLLYAPVRPKDLPTYINAVDSSMEGCGFLLGKVQSRSGERRNLDNDWCRGWPTTWSNRVNEQDPALAVIMIGAWDVFDLTLPDGTVLDFASPAWDQNFRQALGQAVDILSAPDRLVALSLLPCFRPVASSLGSGSGYWPERGDDDRTRHINELLVRAAEEDPSRVITLEPPVEFCTDPVISHSGSYRWDGIHYNTKGAALYFQAVLPQILSPAALQGSSATPTVTTATPSSP
jgi:hypothetical protein